MHASTDPARERIASRRRIGPLGVAARLAIGATFIAAALIWRTPRWPDLALGLVAMPAVAIGTLAWRARRHPVDLDATGPVGHLVNLVLFMPLFFLPATAGGAFLFYGVSMLVAATRRSSGCEITAIANATLARDDQVGCVLFGPIDSAESAFERIRAPRTAEGADSAQP